MTRTFAVVSRVFAALMLSTTLIVVSASLATASAKPTGDLVPVGAKVLFWNYPPSVSAAARSSKITVKNATIIRKVRSLINALPVTSSAPRVCPDDLMMPTSLTFATSISSTPFTKVVFQLGGCPYARVYQHGVAVSPTLGGTNLSQVYNQIERLVGAKS